MDNQDIYDSFDEDFLDKLDDINSKSKYSPVESLIKGLDYLNRKGIDSISTVYEGLIVHPENNLNKVDFEIMYYHGWIWSSNFQGFCYYVQDYLS